jgi:hypothetical protein
VSFRVTEEGKGLEEDVCEKSQDNVSECIRTFMPQKIVDDGDVQARKIIGHTISRNPAHQSDRLVIADHTEVSCLD